MAIILVQLSEKLWTMQAVHLACALARNNRARVILLRITPVRHLSYLGTPFGDEPLSTQEYTDMKEYAVTAEDYGVELTLQPMQCYSAFDALADAAEQLDARIVFANIPPSRLPYWQRFQAWQLERRFSAAHRQLFTLNKSNRSNQLPSVTITPAHHPVGK
jgi:hypothetical protein